MGEISHKRIKGFADMFPPRSNTFHFMEATAASHFGNFGFVELRTPILEFTDLFKRSIGEETDVVGKEMYSFPDSRGRSLSLRPEATAGVLRAAIESGQLGEGVMRLFTCGPMFRHEQPQKGRMRQFHQINCECLGSASPQTDAEVIAMLMGFVARIGVADKVSLKLNSLGCASCRPVYRKELQDFVLARSGDGLCEDCRRRVQTNPLRVLDCKQEACRNITNGAPRLLDHNCPECASHFSTVLDLISAAGIAHEIDHRLVRGLDYYCRTTFELVSGDIGAQSAVAGGGRYDGLVRNLGGPDVPGIGFACGMERLELLMEECAAPRPLFFAFGMDEAGRKQAFSLALKLRGDGYFGILASGQTSFKSMMRQAGKSGAQLCLIIGEDEARDGTVTVKDMDGGGQQTLPQDNLKQYLNAR